ncbi:glycosyltransferase, group 2 family protein [Bifidobacterium dolichotidis]|uniref:Glycosyltransferase, group 2 family protein n=1 Tax=Bifidobacterium dolichotidis TaxID=2306976 RepID=A0A430FK95_9BIFI|nr:glycosyltransferase [Bifidobacterium dolichotidis]RSX53335.1 glycosyltransferase, group 2 family protein [Bifidobacterium dolichotidis]
MHIEVTAIVVSYNRERLLRDCLTGIQRQTRRPDHVIVVDNASTDHAVRVAKTHPLHAHVIQLHNNYGGAGGFCAGIALAMQHYYKPNTIQYVWVMDDDTIPTRTALEQLLATVQTNVDENGVLPTVLGSKAIWIDGREHLMNKPRLRTFVRKGVRFLQGSANAYQVRSLSFVSCLINMGAIAGLKRLPESAYFLWNDDFEFTSALLKRGIGYYVPNSVVEHRTKVFGSSDADPGARFVNEVRNKIWMLRLRARDFYVEEYVELLLKTVRRWVLTIARSDNRAALLKYFREGWNEGWHTKPATNEQIFINEPMIEAAVKSVLD